MLRFEDVEVGDRIAFNKSHHCTQFENNIGTVTAKFVLSGQYLLTVDFDRYLGIAGYGRISFARDGHGLYLVCPNTAFDIIREGGDHAGETIPDWRPGYID